MKNQPKQQAIAILSIAFLGVLFCAPSTMAGTIDVISKSVAFIKLDQPVSVNEKGINYEIWKKRPDATNYERAFNTVSGSGLIVISSRIIYLVTAKHVANDVGEDAQIIVKGDNNLPITYALRSMNESPIPHVGEPTNINGITGLPVQFELIKWICQSNADIAIHPLLTPQNLWGIPLDALEPGQNLPSRDTFVTVLGFPLGLGAEGEFEPLSRETKLSSGLLTDKNDGSKYFLLLLRRL